MRNLSLILVLCAAAWAQRTLEYDHSVVSQVRIDARDLGYAPVDLIPSEESAIGALSVGPEGAIYGATSGKRSHLFVLYPEHGYVQPLGFLPGMTTVHKAIVVSKNGDVYIGGGNGSGHLLRYTPHNDEEKPIRVDVACDVADLGIPVPGEGVYAMAIDRARNVIYGLSYPNGQFFSYDIATGKAIIHGKVAEHNIPGEKFEKEKNIGRELLATAAGFVFVSGESGALYLFNESSQKLDKLRLTAPTVPGREVYNRVDAWAEDSKGMVFGGTSDGYLFRLDPKTLTLQNLGKPLNQYRIRGVVCAPNGKLYGVGGDDDEMARLFSYNPSNGAYEMLGMIDVNRRPYYAWQAYVIDAMAIGADGTVYLGQSERKSKLYLYYPE